MNTTKCQSRKCPINGHVNIKFETDAEDKFFNEELGNGSLNYSHDILYQKSLRTGIFSLTLKPSLGFSDLVVGQKINFQLTILDKKKTRDIFEIPIEITEAEIKIPKPPRPPGPPPKPRIPYTRIIKPNKDSKNKKSFIDTPIVKTLSKEKNEKKWQQHFEGKIRRGASVEISSDGQIKFFVNISHPNLLQYQELHPEFNTKKKTQSLMERYAYYIAFNSWSFNLLYDHKLIPYDEKTDPQKMMEIISDSLAYFGLSYSDAAK